MLIHVVADYGVGDLAYAEVRQRLALHLPGVDVVYTPVGPFDTLAAGFCIAQLALGEGPSERVVYHNVAPREDEDAPRPDNEGEGLVAVRLASGALVVGVNAGYAFSFLRDEVDALSAVAVPDSGSQFRSRDAFPALLPQLLDEDPAILAASVSPTDIPAVPDSVIAYVDGYGNLKTTWADPPLEPGREVSIRIGGVTATAVAGEATFGVAAGDLAFAPGSSGWRRRDGSQVQWWELLARGASAAELFGQPATGTRVQLLP